MHVKSKDTFLNEPLFHFGTDKIGYRLCKLTLYKLGAVSVSVCSISEAHLQYHGRCALLAIINWLTSVTME